MIGLSVKRIGESLVIFGTEGVKEVGKGVKRHWREYQEDI
jgi:hypothetical protein